MKGEIKTMKNLEKINTEFNIENINYYNEIKEQLINNEINKRVKDYSKNKTELTTYYNVGKLLSEAGKHYGENIIGQYSKKLTQELGKGYSTRSLKYMRKYYYFQKVQSMTANLSWGHWIELLSLNDINQTRFYIKQCCVFTLTTRQLRERIKNKEYERLPESTRLSLLSNNEINKQIELIDTIKNPIIIDTKGRYKNYEYITEKIFHRFLKN